MVTASPAGTGDADEVTHTMVEKLIDLIARAARRLVRPMVMTIDWFHEEFTLWTVMRHPRTSEPVGAPGNSRAERMSRYFRVSPEPTDKLAVWLTGWTAVALVVTSVVLFATGLPEFAWLTTLAGVLSWLVALEQTAGYEIEYRRSLPKPDPADVDGFLRASLDRAVSDALTGTGLTAEAVETAIRRALPDLPVDDDTYARPPVALGPVYDDKELPVILGTQAARYRAYHVLVLCPTDHHLVLYRARLDMVEGKLGKAEFRELYPRDVTLMTVVDSVPDVTFHARHDDGALIGTRVEKVKLRELAIGSGEDEGRLTVMLSPGGELDAFLRALRGLLRAHKTAETPVHIVRPLPLPMRMEEPGPDPQPVDIAS